MPPSTTPLGGLAGMNGGLNGFAPPPGAGPPGGLPLPGLGGLGGALGGMGMQPPQHMPAGFVPGGPSGGHDPLRMQQQGLPPLGGAPPGLPPDLLNFGGAQQLGAPPMQPPAQQPAGRPPPFGGLSGLAGLGADLPPALAGLDPATVQGLMQMPTLDLFGAGTPGGAPPPRAGAPAGPPGGPSSTLQQAQAAAAAAAAMAGGGGGGGRGGPPGGGMLPPELAHLLKEDSMSPFEDPNFQHLMSMMAGTGPANGPQGGGASGGAAPPAAAPTPGPRGAPVRTTSSSRDKQAKRKAGVWQAAVGHLCSPPSCMPTSVLR
jgi:hypothetical protein